LGVAALEDKIVQQAVVTILNQIYEVDFNGFSYGFRPGRSPHQALDALTVGIQRKRVCYKVWRSQRFQQDFVGLQQDGAHRLLQRGIARIHQRDRVQIGVPHRTDHSEAIRRSGHVQVREQHIANIALAAEHVLHERKLDRLAEVAVQVGLGLKLGQELVMTASIDALPLGRHITEQAYRAGASLVTTLYSDDSAALMRYRFAPDESFDRATNWLYEGMAAAFRNGAARLAITGADPLLLSSEDPEKVGRANQAVSKAYRPALELITRHEINWTIVASATPA
jgi:hypothetical protein